MSRKLIEEMLDFQMGTASAKGKDNKDTTKQEIKPTSTQENNRAIEQDEKRTIETEVKNSTSQDINNSGDKEVKESTIQEATEISNSEKPHRGRPRKEMLSSSKQQKKENRVIESGGIRRGPANITIREDYHIALNVIAARRQVKMWVLLDEAVGAYLAAPEQKRLL